MSGLATTWSRSTKQAACCRSCGERRMAELAWARRLRSRARRVLGAEAEAEAEEDDEEAKPVRLLPAWPDAVEAELELEEVEEEEEAETRFWGSGTRACRVRPVMTLFCLCTFYAGISEGQEGDEAGAARRKNRRRMEEGEKKTEQEPVVWWSEDDDDQVGRGSIARW
ncbi:hypothetical protein BCV70DRAFT_120467 [Testicularia cyperi]|uniref:Uncharacterized protein n=1 Tax=Testicularia cyperi TaxID=1882483 RepID=A0A317XMJ4_9BASI|nr:hypothetical protein BCV70DRAFT_120467 [Testicularia cyperi]